jgi:hypothetical protein
MKESIHLFLLCVFYSVCLLVTVMCPLGNLVTLLLWAIGSSPFYHGSPQTLHAAAPGEWIGGIGRL